MWCASQTISIASIVLEWRLILISQNNGQIKSKLLMAKYTTDISEKMCFFF